ncbi:UNVERIFIED_CONTAM: hypothetical protein HDU68_005479, partial [Siphonaria sp. JEL0065]
FSRHPSIRITDLIANASKCNPCKPFITDYEDSIDLSSAPTKWISKLKQKGSPSIDCYKALHVFGSFDWDVGDTISDFTNLLQLVLHTGNHFNDSFLDIPTLTYLKIEGGGHEVQLWQALKVHQSRQFCHVSMKHLPYHLPFISATMNALAISQVLNAPFKLKSLGLSVSGTFKVKESPLALSLFVNMVKTCPAYRTTLSELETIVIDASVGNNGSKFPKATEPIVQLLSALKFLPSLVVVIVENLVREDGYEDVLQLLKETGVRVRFAKTILR